MAKYFGTDGIRGEANTDLTPELVMKVGRVSAHVLGEKISNPTFIIGRDSRLSGTMLESALAAGICSAGANVILVGIVPTPAVSYLVKHKAATAGIVISASHNPMEDNGIKFFGADGYKLPDKVEEAMENELELLINNEIKFERPKGSDVGYIINDFDAVDIYQQYLADSFPVDLDGFNIILDTANGAAYNIAPLILKNKGANITTIACNPNGLNINDNCGSTHPENLIELVKTNQADIGIAFDGDADRFIAVDEKANIVNGDHILALFAKYFQAENKLANNQLIVTVMSNLGLKQAMEELNIEVITTDVGDSHVLSEMSKTGANLGGEQSGHIILRDINTTGDGIAAALQTLTIMAKTNKPLSELSKAMQTLPQVLKNVPVTDKKAWRNNKDIQDAIKLVEQRLDDIGRILVRESGTEELIRVMIEGPDYGEIEALADDVVAEIESAYGI